MLKNHKTYSFLMLSFFYYKRFGWIRLFGVGLSFKNTNTHELTFSERNSLTKRIQIGNWSISLIK